MMRYVFALVLMVLSGPALAENGSFASYQDLRHQLDPLVTSRQMAAVLTLFGGSDEMTPEELKRLDEQVLSLYKQDFTQVQLINRVDLANGWRQEMLGYWVGYQYIYVYMLLQQLPDELRAVQFKFNSDFERIFSNF